MSNGYGTYGKVPFIVTKANGHKVEFVPKPAMLPRRCWCPFCPALMAPTPDGSSMRCTNEKCQTIMPAGWVGVKAA